MAHSITKLLLIDKKLGLQISEFVHNPFVAGQSRDTGLRAQFLHHHSVFRHDPRLVLLTFIVTVDSVPRQGLLAHTHFPFHG